MRAMKRLALALCLSSLAGCSHPVTEMTAVRVVRAPAAPVLSATPSSRASAPTPPIAPPPPPRGSETSPVSDRPSTRDFDKPRLETYVRDECNKQYASREVPWSCISVTLYTVDAGHFEGYGEPSNGGRLSVTVALADEGIIWKASPYG